VNKADLISNVAEAVKLDKKTAEAAVNAVLDGIQYALENDEKVQIIGFGTFQVKERKERQGRNPRNPEQSITIPASKAPVFKAGKSLKEAVNK